MKPLKKVYFQSFYFCVHKAKNLLKNNLMIFSNKNWAFPMNSKIQVQLV